MKGKLIKENNGYTLFVDGKIFGDTEGYPLKSITNRLSLKNCQIIELDCDLDELAYSCFPNGTYETSEIDLGLDMYKKGFQKALELIGDKKYSEEDIKEAYLSGVDDAMDIKYDPNATIDDEKYLKSLQQTEWDVEIKMVKEHIGAGCYKKYPKLNATGCLILKRI